MLSPTPNRRKVPQAEDKCIRKDHGTEFNLFLNLLDI
jgi:hypothetical protein